MKSLLAMEKDIFSQIDSISSFIPQKKLGVKRQNRSVFCGSGDSLAACMLAESHSDMRVRAADPLDLIKNPNVILDKDLYIVSISGKTISNIRASRFTKSSTAITSNLQSKLAKSCDKTIHLKFQNSDTLTAGTVSFLDSALTCMSLVTNIRIHGAKKIFENALEGAKLATHDNCRVFFLGNLHTYPIAMYAAAKIYETTGHDAYYERLEQFSHMELFSAKRGDKVVIFEHGNRHCNNLVSELESTGLKVVHPKIPGGKIEQFLFCTFYAQIVPLLHAKQRGQSDCYFMTSKKLRAASDKMIY